MDFEVKFMKGNATKWTVIGGVLAILVIAGFMYGWPQYKVWQKGLKGKAELKRAEYNRKIAVREAQAKMEAAKMLAKAEVERAKGVAEANRIIGNSLKNNSAYLRYLWIQGLHDGSSEVIYVPTEANLPVLEATRKLQKRPEPPAKAK